MLAKSPANITMQLIAEEREKKNGGERKNVFKYSFDARIGEIE